jgi:hypothetical protein
MQKLAGEKNGSTKKEGFAHAPRQKTFAGVEVRCARFFPLHQVRRAESPAQSMPLMRIL